LTTKYPPERLSPQQYRLYLDHGKALAIYPINVDEFARKLGVHKHHVLAIKSWVEAHGPPMGERPTGATHIVIGDAHSKPDQDLRRFGWLGKLIEEEGRAAMSARVPFRVIQIGDWFDMAALSSYDKGKGSGEERRYLDDIAAGQDAYARVRANVSDEVYDYADKVAIEGNHEFRVHRYMNDNAELLGLMEGPREVSEEFGWTWVPFMTWKVLDGVGYCHYMQNPNGMAVSGVNVARSLLLKGYRSVTVGHNHMLDTYTTTDAWGTPIQTLSSGCFFEDIEPYAKQSNDKWWRGVCIKSNVQNGAYDLKTVGLSTLRRRFE
jgi:hypothetical protein